MISVIVPTMWAYQPFLNFLENLVELNCVGEVIIINNCVEDTPTHKALMHEKVKMHNMPRNTYVNPAWNLGASLSNNDILCFLSDDVLVDLRAFQEANKFVTKDIGVLGFGYTNELFFLHASKEITTTDSGAITITGDIVIKEESQHAQIGGNGSLFFLHKENYIPIPNQFLISGGDSWLYEVQKIKGRNNYFINNCFYYSPWSVTGREKNLGGHGDFSQENRETYLRLIEEFKTKEKVQ